MTSHVDPDPSAKAYNKALRLLGVRNRSCKEIKDRLLAASFADDLADQVVERLCQSGLLDDHRFARERARAMGKSKGWGPRKLRWDLSRYGLASDQIDQAIEQTYDSQSCVSIMRKLVKKRFGERALTGDDLKLRSKVYRYLLGRGFEPDQVHEVLQP